MPERAALFRNRNFLLVWLASLISNLALAVATLAETWYIVRALNAEAKLGIVMIAASVPRIALMLVGGSLADRFRRSRIILASLLLRVVLMFGLVYLLSHGALSITILAAFALAYGALDAFFWPARDALLPGVVGGADLLRANSIMLTTNQIGLVGGPVIGGALLALFSYRAVFALTGGVLLVGVLCIAATNDAAMVPRRSRRPLLAEIGEGIRYAWHTPVLRALMLIYACANLLFMGPLGLGIPIIVADHLHGQASTLAYLQSAFAAGMVLGGLWLTLHPPRRKRLRVIAGVIALEGVLLALLGQSYWLWVCVGLQCLLGIGVVANNIPMMSLLQQYTAHDKLGRVMSLNSVASMGLSPLSYALVTVLLAQGGDIRWLLPSFGLSMSCCMLAFIWWLPAIRQTD